MARISLRTALSPAGLAEGLLALRLALASWVDDRSAPFALRRQPELFRHLETVCLFIGYPRSGHSLIGSLIDAHPHALIAHRVDALKYLQRGRSATEVFYLLMKSSRRFARRGRRLTGYSFPIPDQWQGEVEALRLIGDQEGRKTGERLAADPVLRDRLRDLDGIAVKLLHVVRNPYDNISTMARRTNQDLGHNIERYFSLCRNVAAVKREARALEMLDIRFEGFLDDPEKELLRTLAFLGLAAPEPWLRSVLAIVRRTPHRSRHEMPWTDDLVASVRERAARFEFLQGYGYDS